MFPADMLPAMIAPFLEGEAGMHWLVAENGGQLVGFLYSAPELLTEGTNNLRAMATAVDVRETGIGSRLIGELETVLARASERILLVETSSAREFAATRDFYRKRGFREEARIRDFWAPGDHKVIFWKTIEGRSA